MLLVEGGDLTHGSASLLAVHRMGFKSEWAKLFQISPVLSHQFDNRFVSVLSSPGNCQGCCGGLAVCQMPGA